MFYYYIFAFVVSTFVNVVAWSPIVKHNYSFIAFLNDFVVVVIIFIFTWKGGGFINVEQMEQLYNNKKISFWQAVSSDKDRTKLTKFLGIEISVKTGLRRRV